LGWRSTSSTARPNASGARLLARALGVLKPGAIGKPVPGHTVAVIGNDGGRLKAGEVGQIAVLRPDP